MKFFYEGKVVELRYGSVVIVVIISCINIFNFSVMIGVGFVVKKGIELGLEVSFFFKIKIFIWRFGYMMLLKRFWEIFCVWFKLYICV